MLSTVIRSIEEIETSVEGLRKPTTLRKIVNHDRLMHDGLKV